jgi:hypothetical protein
VSSKDHSQVTVYAAPEPNEDAALPKERETTDPVDVFRGSAFTGHRG